MRMPLSVLVLILADLILAGLALYGGINLMLDPSGTSMQIDHALVYIPFVSDFMLFGIWLVVAFAALPAIAAYLIYRESRWGLYGSLALAALEILWIATQVVVLYPLGISSWWPAILSYSLVVAAIAVASVYLVFFRDSVKSYFGWEYTAPLQSGFKLK